MRLYKYRSLQNMKYIDDILTNQRFHAATFEDLNDPMEGYYEYFKTEYGPEIINSLYDEKKRHLICSFSQFPDRMLMWSHYADQFRGICIELDLKRNRNGNYEIEPIKYSYRRTQLDDLKHLVDIDEKAKYLLRHKLKLWNYEREIRVFSLSKDIQDGVTIKSIRLGLRISDKNRNYIIEKTSSGIPIYETCINDDNKVVKGKEISRS